MLRLKHNLREGKAVYKLTFSKLGLSAMVAILLAGCMSFIAGAVLPDSEGAFYACRDDSAGSITMTTVNTACGSGESGMQWDRGVIGYAYSPSLNTGDEYVEYLKGNMPVAVTKISSGQGTYVLCVDLPQDVLLSARFATVDGSAGDLVLRDKDITSVDLDASCGTSY